MRRVYRFGLTSLSFLVVSCAAVQSGEIHSLPAQPNPQNAPESRGDTQPTTEVAAETDYHPYAEFAALLSRLAERAGPVARLKSIAETTGGRKVWVLTLAAPADKPPERRQALLIVGGIDAEHAAGGETALRVAQRLVAAHADEPDGAVARLLRKRTIHIVPRANPDGVERYFEALRHESTLSARALDEDRDGVVDEDGPDDLNGDGLITVMRIADRRGEWMPDPDEPRLLKRADRAKGESGQYRLMLEGIDNDADGKVNEDGPGGVDLDRNWPHFYEPDLLITGAHQISEPATRALAEFIVDHPNISTAIVYGRHDNIVNVPEGKQRGPAGEAYRDLHPEDVPLYKHISARFKQITGLRGSPGAEPAGALYAWLYSQRAIPTFATTLWWPLEEKAATDEEEGDQRPEQSTTQPASAPATRPAPDRAAQADDEQPPARAARRGPRGRHGGSGAAPGEKGQEQPEDPVAARVASTEVAKKWLAYSDKQRDGAGFVEWTPVEHPEFGRVEVGGRAPYFTTAPPAEELDLIADRQVDFLSALSEMLPEPHFGSAEVEDLGADIWRIELPLVNDGYLPTHLAIAVQTEQPPLTVRPQVDAERIIGGNRVERVAKIPGSGGVVELRWLIRGKAGETVTFRAYNRVYGELLTEIKLQETAKKGASD